MLLSDSQYSLSYKQKRAPLFRYEETADELRNLTNPTKYHKYLRPYHRGTVRDSEFPVMFTGDFFVCRHVFYLCLQVTLLM